MSDPLIDIRPDHWAIVVDILRRHVPDREVWAVGSRAKWSAKEYSDLDLAVIGEHPLSLSVSAALADDFSESDLPFKVDVVDWATTSESFRKIIERDKVAVQRAAKRFGLPGETQRGTLGDYFTIQRGTTYKSRLLRQPGPVLLGLATIQRNGGFRRDALETYGGHSPDKLLVQPGQLYLSLKDVTQSADLLGAVARLPLDHPRGRLTQDTVKLEPKGGDVPLDYLYWLLRTPQYRRYCRAHATGTTNLGLAREDFLAFSAPEPTPMQRRIADTLGTLDNKIELNRRMNATLEAMARALFKSWFVDFDPVRAKAEGRDPGLPQPLADLFPKCFVDSELGEIPAGWEVGKLGDVAEHPRRGLQPEKIEPDTPYIALDHMPKRCIALSNWGTADALESNKFEFKTGEILFGKLRPYFHKVGVAPVDGVCSTDIVVVAPKSEHWFGFVLAHASSDAFVEHTNAGSTGTKMPRTNWGDMARYEIVIPSRPVAEKFGSYMRLTVERINAAIYESRTLAALRDTLLPKLISGDLRMSEAEIAH
ncbi:MAG: nucleotidyltransferase domain-containing protein [Gammaproteobacteria bacterium]